MGKFTTKTTKALAFQVVKLLVGEQFLYPWVYLIGCKFYYSSIEPESP